MDKRRKRDSPTLSDLDRWRNVCDAGAEDFLHDPPGHFGRWGDAISLKLDLAHLARPGETPEEHIARLQHELQRLTHRIPKVNFKEALRDRAHQIAQYGNKLREVQKAAGLPPTYPEMPKRRATKKRQPVAETGVSSERRKEPRKGKKKQSDL